MANVGHEVRFPRAMDALIIASDHGLPVPMTVIGPHPGPYEVRLTYVASLPGPNGHRIEGEFLDRLAWYTSLYPKGFRGEARPLDGYVGATIVPK